MFEALDEWFGQAEPGEAEPVEQEQSSDSYYADVIGGALGGWVFQVIGFAACLKHGDFFGINDYTFRVPWSECWNSGAVMALLRQHGIDLYGFTIANRVQLFTVCKDDAKRTQRIFNAYGVPLV